MAKQIKISELPKDPNSPDKILITEDDLKQAEKIEKVLKEFGYDLLYAEDGMRALGILSQKPIDLVILDLEMPKTKGDQVLRVARSLPILDNIPFVVYTAVKDWEKGLEESLRWRVRGDFPEVTYEKREKESMFTRLFHLKEARFLLPKIKQLLQERRKQRYGYLGQPLTFFQNDHGDWMPGALELYQPLPPDAIERDDVFSYCNYCSSYFLCPDLFESRIDYCYKYDKTKLLPKTTLFDSLTCEAIICRDCVRTLKEKEPNFAKLFL